MGRKAQVESLAGRHFDRWTVLDECIVNERGERKWLCRCTCGTERYVAQRSLLSGNSKSCGCKRSESIVQATSPDLTGKKYGELTVLRRSYKKHRNAGSYWICQCSCGNEYETTGSLLVTGRRNHCSNPLHTHRGYSDITGKKFGKLTALYPLKKTDKSRSRIWHCLCDCGQEVDKSYNSLQYGNVQSCGCIRKEYNQQLSNHLTHVDGTSMDILKSKKTPSDNTTGCKGVYRIRGKYVAKIVFQKKAYYLGTFEDYEEAVNARKEAESVIFEEVVLFYKEWQQKAEEDRQWAVENPIKIRVNKEHDGRLKVSCSPVL